MNAVLIAGKGGWQKMLARKLWIAFRFVVFGVGGFLLLWFSMIALVMEFSPPSEHLMSPYLALPLAFLGALMMLYGAGEWGRWGYLLVFVSTPLVAFLAFIIPWPKWFEDSMGNKGSFVLFLALPFVLSYIAVRRFYRRRDARNNSTAHEDLPGSISEEQPTK
jgi:hypothetical protein